MKTNINNIIIALIVFFINVRDNKKYIFSAINTIQLSISDANKP
jgi:hypothetical protein